MKASLRVLVGLVLALAYAALLGWLKTLYYLEPFSLSPASTLEGWPGALFESWYVVQNVVYFALIVWLVVQTRCLCLALVAGAYALLPLATHYAFLGYSNRAIRWWVDHQHTWLKLVPFVLIAIVLVAAIRRRGIDPRWRHGAAGGVLFGIVVGSWGLSAAKHFGSYDAERVLHRPRELLARIELTWKDPSADVVAGGDDLLLLFSGPRSIVVAAFRQAPAWTRGRPVVHTISLDALERVAVFPATAVQPGGQYF